METFDERAATWDDPDKVERARAIARSIAAKVPLGPELRLFEYGAGTGLVSEALRDEVGTITMADTSEGMRDQMQCKVDDGRLTGAQVWDLDLSHAPVPDGATFDLVVTSMVLHHVDSLETTLRAFATLLAPDGHLCVVDLDAEDGSFHGSDVDVHHGFDRGEFGSLLRAAGFTNVDFSDCHTVERDGDEYGLFLAVARP